MANALYPLWKQEVIKATANTALTGTVKVALVDTGTYTYSASHQFYSSVSGVAGTIYNTQVFSTGIIGYGRLAEVITTEHVVESINDDRFITSAESNNFISYTSTFNYIRDISSYKYVYNPTEYRYIQDVPVLRSVP